MFVQIFCWQTLWSWADEFGTGCFNLRLYRCNGRKPRILTSSIIQLSESISSAAVDQYVISVATFSDVIFVKRGPTLFIFQWNIDLLEIDWWWNCNVQSSALLCENRNICLERKIQIQIIWRWSENRSLKPLNIRYIYVWPQSSSLRLTQATLRRHLFNWGKTPRIRVIKIWNQDQLSELKPWVKVTTIYIWKKKLLQRKHWSKSWFSTSILYTVHLFLCTAPRFLLTICFLAWWPSLYWSPSVVPG